MDHVNTEDKDGADYFEQGVGEILFIAFTSINDGIAGLKRFELMKTFGSTRSRVLFVRDSSVRWYQHGIVGVPGGVDGLCKFLENTKNRCKTTVALGYSAGGYAALLFSHLVGFDLTIAICPQTNITPEFRGIIGDMRWQNQIAKTFQSGLSDYADLRKIVALNSLNKRIIILGDKDKLDTAHLNYYMRDWGDGRPETFRIPESNHNTCIGPLRHYGFFDAITSLVEDGCFEGATERIIGFCGAGQRRWELREQ